MRNWIVKEGFPLPAAFMTPVGATRTARTAGSKPSASGKGVYPQGPLAPVDEYMTLVA